MPQNFASMKLRLSAAVIDMVFICCVFFPVVYAFVVLTILIVTIVLPIPFWEFLLVIVIIVVCMLAAKFPHLGAREGDVSFGKRMMGIEVVNLDGSPVRFKTLCLRNLGRLLSLAVLGLGFWFLEKSPKKQALYDRWVGTVVVKKKPVSRA